MELYIKLFALAMGLVGNIGLIGNIVVIIIYLYDKRLTSYTNYFFINLSVVDILILVVCLPVALLDLSNEGTWMLGELVCNMQHFVESALISASSLTLISIAVERFLAISFPLQTKQVINKKSIICVLIALWIVSILSSAPLIKYTRYGVHEGVNGTTISYCYNDRSWLFPKIYQAMFISVFLIAPSLILIVIYILIVLKLRHLNRNLSFARDPNNNQNNINNTTKPPNQTYRNIRRQHSQMTDSYESLNDTTTSTTIRMSQAAATSMTRESSLVRNSPNSVSRTSSNYTQLIAKRKQTIMICFVSLTFFICQIPIKLFQIFNTFYTFDEEISEEKAALRFQILNIVFLSTKFLFFLHGMSNPIIYNLMSTKFNQSFRKVILCKSLNYTPKKQRHHKVSSPARL